MPNYQRAPVAGATYFFTLALADRRSGLLVSHIEALRLAYRRARDLHPFATVAICVMPDHLHAIWRLPQGDVDFALRWRVLKSGFSRQFAADSRRSPSKIRRREKGIWQRRYWEHRFGMTAICSGMWITSITIRSSTGMRCTYVIGSSVVSIGTSH